MSKDLDMKEKNIRYLSYVLSGDSHICFFCDKSA